MTAEDELKLAIFQQFAAEKGLNGDAILQDLPESTVRYSERDCRDRVFRLAEIVDANFGNPYSRYNTNPLMTLREKCQHSHQSEVEADLILYSDSCPLPPRNTWEDQLRIRAESLLPMGSFTNLYVFDVGKRSIEFEL